MKWCLVIISGILALALSENVKVSYKNHKVYNVVPQTEEHVQMLIDLHKDDRYDFWSEQFGVGKEVRVLVSPKIEMDFRKYINTAGLDARISITDVEELINAQRKPSSNVNRNIAGDYSFSTYHDLDTIYAWLDQLIELYPNAVTGITIGNSYEGRPIRGIKIDYHQDSRVGRPLIAFIEGGIHAREWISPATVTGIVNEFLTSTDSSVRRLAEAFEWHIIPVLNPDGYVYTFTTNRMWRKNRNPSYNKTCSAAGNDNSNGVDLNRNFDFRWMTVGASDDSCDSTYAGPSAFSEPESRAMSNYVLTQKQRGQAIYYFTFHSYSQLIIVPFSHASGAQKLEADNYGDLFEIAIRGTDMLTAKHGTPYITGTSPEILYAISGGSFDWAKGTAEIPITYLIELRDRGETGFLLPTEQIIPNNEEIMEWLIEADRVTRQLNYYADNFPTAGAATVINSLLLLITSAGAMFLMR